MKKTLWLKLTVILLPFLILLQVLSGLFSDELKTLFPPLHIAGAALILLIGGVHLALNWGWVRKQIFSK
jgi:hypothetical protein